MRALQSRILRLRLWSFFVYFPRTYRSRAGAISVLVLRCVYCIYFYYFFFFPEITLPADNVPRPLARLPPAIRRERVLCGRSELQFCRNSTLETEAKTKNDHERSRSRTSSYGGLKSLSRVKNLFDFKALTGNFPFDFVLTWLVIVLLTVTFNWIQVESIQNLFFVYKHFVRYGTLFYKRTKYIYCSMICVAQQSSGPVNIYL